METIISKIKIRRGTDEQRKQVVFDVGEPAFAYNTGRLCIGDGQLSGGVPINKTYVLSGNDLSAANGAVKGDLAYTNNRLHIAVDDNNHWEDAGVKLKEGGGLTYGNDNQLEIQTPSNPLTISNNQLALKYDDVYFNTNDDKLTINSGVINYYNFTSDDFTDIISDESPNTHVINIDKVGAIQTIDFPLSSYTATNNETYYVSNTGLGVVTANPLTVKTAPADVIVNIPFSGLPPAIQQELTATEIFSEYESDSEIGVLSTVETEALALKIDNNTLSVNDGKLTVIGSTDMSGDLSIGENYQFSAYQLYPNRFCTQFGHIQGMLHDLVNVNEIRLSLPMSYGYPYYYTAIVNNGRVYYDTSLFEDWVFRIYKASDSILIQIPDDKQLSSYPLSTTIEFDWTTNGFITQ